MRKYGSREKRARCQLDGLFFGEDDEHVEGCRVGDILKSSENRIVWKGELMIKFLLCKVSNPQKE